MNKLITIDKDYSIRLAKHEVQFCKVYPITELDDIILELLALNGDKMGFVNLGLTLGFAVKEIPSDDIHYDQAEVAILEDLLEPLQRFHLITIDTANFEERWIRTTHWGKMAKNLNKKRLFFEGEINLPEHYLIQISEKRNAQFPFKKFGIHSRIVDFRECEPFEIEESSTPEDLKQLLAKRNLEEVQEKNITIEINRIEPNPNGYNSKRLIVEVSLVETSGIFEIETSIEGQSSPELDELIRSSPDQHFYQGWLNEACYHHYFEFSNQLTAEALEEYTNYVEWSKVLNDKRTVWDESLLSLLSKDFIATYEIWTLVCENAPREIILKYFDKYKKLWNWYLISENLPVSFIVAHANDYDWDFDALIKRLDSDGIESLLGVLENYDAIPDWTAITKKVSESFLKKNITKYPFDLYFLSKSRDFDIYELVLDNPHLNWDWYNIARYWPFEFILENYSKLSAKLDLKSLLIRALNNLNELEVLLGSDYAITQIQSTIKSTEVTFSSKDNIILNKQSLDFLHDNNLLFWGYGNIAGIEANPNLKWTASIFMEYHSKVKTEEGYANVSSSITELELVESYPNFPWDFRMLSKRSDLQWNIHFIRDNKEKLYPIELLSQLPGSFIADHLHFFIDWLGVGDLLLELSSIVSNKFSFTQIKANSEPLIKIEAKIDWESVLSHYNNEELNTLAYELGNTHKVLPSFTSLCIYLTKKCNLDFILGHPDLYWDWKFITEARLETERLKNQDFQWEYAQYLYWPYILSEITSSSEIATLDILKLIAYALTKASEGIRTESWRIITEKMPRYQLWKLIRVPEGSEIFQWDWDIISSMDNLAISHDFLSRYLDKLNWHLLSQNPYLNEFFRFDRAAYRSEREWIKRCRKYLYAYRKKWDFKALSHIDNLTWNVSIISEFEDAWDWTVLSSQSNLLIRRDKGSNMLEYRTKILKKFSDRIDWKVLSLRYEVKITIELINQFSEQAWDWSALSAHPKFELNQDYLISHKDKPWDFKALTTHPKLKLNKELLIELEDKEWDFKKISNKSWIDNELILKFKDKDWDWSLISANSSIIPDLNLLQVFATKEDIDWKSVLQNPNLHITIETLKIIHKQAQVDSTCWDILSEHPNLNFTYHPDMLQSYQDYWNWRLLIDNHKIDINEPALLQKYQTYIDWQYLSQQEQFRPSEEISFAFAEYLDWYSVTRKIQLTIPLLEKFKDYLDWSFISKTDKLEFTPEIIEQFKFHWDYYELKDNVALSHASRSKVNEIIQEIPELEFYFRLKQQNSKWSGYIYHYTTLENAIEILEKKEIRSRASLRSIEFFNCASRKIVNSSPIPHKYARFYFRPQTPYQFYNQNLGKDLNNKESIFDEWRALDSPICPSPVIFRIDLQEIILKHHKQLINSILISEGNMHRKRAMHSFINNMVPFFNFEDLYSNINDTSDGEWETYKRYSQQEFLVKSALCLKNLSNIDVITYDTSARKILTQFQSCSDLRINVVSSQEFCFHDFNPSVDIEIDKQILKIDMNICSDQVINYPLLINLDQEAEIIESSGSIQPISGNQLKATGSLSLKVSTTKNCSVYLEHNGRKTLVYKDYESHLPQKKSSCFIGNV